MITFDLGCRLANSANARECRFVRSRRTRQQRDAAHMTAASVLTAADILRIAVDGATITLTRIGPGNRPMDEHDGLPNAFKPIVDGIAKALCLDDADPRLQWVYRQERGPYGCRVEIE